MRPDFAADAGDDVLILGCGYAGVRLAQQLIRLGHRVTATTRSPERAARLQRRGMAALVLDLDDPRAPVALAELQPQACFCLIPPRAPAVANDERLSGERGLVGRATRALRGLAAGSLGAFVYVSSTGVYGDRAGAWVDEGTAPAPDSEAGRRRLMAETEVLREGRRQGVQVQIARAGGIYGPGRTPRLRLVDGPIPLIEGVQPWTNRVHVEDLAGALVTIWIRGKSGHRYNVVDDEPHHTAEYLRLAGRTLEIAEPIRWISADQARQLPEERLARMTASRRVSNHRLRELGTVLRYPTFRTGLPAALLEDDHGVGDDLETGLEAG